VRSVGFENLFLLCTFYDRQYSLNKEIKCNSRQKERCHFFTFYCHFLRASSKSGDKIKIKVGRQRFWISVSASDSNRNVLWDTGYL